MIIKKTVCWKIVLQNSMILFIVQSNNNGAQAPYVQQLVDAGIPVITTNPTTHQNDLDGGDDTSVMAGTVLLMQIQSSRQKSVQQEL